MKHTKTLFLILTAAIFFCASARSSQIKIESAEANRRPAAVSSGYLAWFPLRIEGQETGPLVYTFRVRNAGEEKIAVRVQVESYIRGSERHDGDESVLTRLEPGESDLLPLRLQPPRTPGSYEAKIVFQTQTPGMMGSLMPWGWDKTHSENLEFRVVDSGSPTFPSPSKPSLGRILSSRPPYEVPTDEAVLMTLNILLDTLGSFAMGETAGIPGVGAEVQARMEPSLLAESLQMQRPRLKERDDKKILSLSALVRDVEVATARYHSYSPGFDRVVFTVILPEGVRVPEQEGWLTESRDGRVAAVGIVEGVDKRIGRMKGIENPSLELRYDDSALEEEYTIESNAMALVGPFSRPADDEALSEAAIWPDTGLQVRHRSRLSEAPWVYDYEKWRRNPNEVTWYAMSKTMPMRVKAEPAERREPRIYTDWPFDTQEAKRRQRESAQQLGIPVEKTVELGDGVEMEFVWIPPGEYMRGEKDNRHRVRLTEGFWMGKTPVTQAQYERITGENPSKFEGNNRPVDNVSWNDAVDFVEKLSEREEGDFRLPTEAEWEYACRAGTDTEYYFGDEADDLGDYAWYRGNSDGQTHPVAQKEPNDWGLYDMHGNVWEWCADWYDDYPSGTVTDPTGPSSGEHRVLRGGSWRYTPRTCRSAHRHRLTPVYRFNLGFRVVLDLP